VRDRLPELEQGGVLVRQIIGGDESVKVVMVVPNRRRGGVANSLVREARRDGKVVEANLLEVGAPDNDVPLVTYDPGPEELYALVVQADCNVVVLFGRDESELGPMGAGFQQLETE
jgi:hypothetical protein